MLLMWSLHQMKLYLTTKSYSNILFSLYSTLPLSKTSPTSMSSMLGLSSSVHTRQALLMRDIIFSKYSGNEQLKMSYLFDYLAGI